MRNVTALVESWAQELTQALEMMTGQPFRASPPAPLEQASQSNLWWTQFVSAPPAASISVGAASDVWSELGTRALGGRHRIGR